MNDLLIELNKDIKRCEEVLRLNNYLEIVIAVEELNDKYKSYLKSINNSNDRVWNYTKKDLENIEDKLKLQKDKLLEDYYKNKENEINIENVIKNTKDKIKENKKLKQDEIKEAIILLDYFYEIYKNKTTKEEKWINLKEKINYLSNQDVYIATQMIYIINLILQSK